MRGAVTVLFLVLAVLLQAAVVNRIPLPWGSPPDLVALTVVAIALGATPSGGALAGFFAGLAMDILPPADHEIGRYALVLCVAGYVVGKLHDSPRHVRGWPYLVTLAAVFGTAVGFAVIGLVLGDARVSLATFLYVIPINVAITMVVSPAVVAPVRRIRRALTDRDLVDATGDMWVTGGIRL